MGPLLPLVVLPTILYKGGGGGFRSLAPYYSIVEGDGENGRRTPTDKSIRYFATQPLVEDGIPRLTFWHHNEQGLHLVQQQIKKF